MNATNKKITQETPVYYINLDSNRARKNNITKMLRMYGFINVTRIPAIDTRTEEKLQQYIERILPESYTILKKNLQYNSRNFHEELTLGSVGCYLSHLNICEKIVQNNLDGALAFEDDCIGIATKREFWNTINNYININDSAHIYLLDANYKEYGIMHPKDKNVRVYRFYGLHAYYITREGAEIMLKNLFPIRYQLDSQMSLLSYAEILKIYGYIGDKKIVAPGHMIFKTTMQNLSCYSCYIKDLEFEARSLTKKNNIEGFDHTDSGNSSTNYIILIAIIVLIFIFILT